MTSGCPPRSAPQFRSLGVNVARWVVPPARLRQLTEAVIEPSMAYVRGDTQRLRPDVAIGAIAAGVPEATIREVRALLAGAADRTVASTDELRVAVAQLADQLAAGLVPDEIPKLGGTTFDPEEVAAAIVDGLGDRVDDDVRTMVLGAVLAGDERDAIISAAALAVEGHASAVAERLGADPSVDLTAVVAALPSSPSRGSSVRSTTPAPSPVGRARGLRSWACSWPAPARRGCSCSSGGGERWPGGPPPPSSGPVRSSSADGSSCAPRSPRHWRSPPRPGRTDGGSRRRRPCS